jgi:hypothetical protein
LASLLSGASRAFHGSKFGAAAGVERGVLKRGEVGFYGFWQCRNHPFSL